MGKSMIYCFRVCVLEALLAGRKSVSLCDLQLEDYSMTSMLMRSTLTCKYLHILCKCKEVLLFLDDCCYLK